MSLLAFLLIYVVSVVILGIIVLLESDYSIDPYDSDFWLVFIPGFNTLFIVCFAGLAILAAFEHALKWIFKK